MTQSSAYWRLRKEAQRRGLIKPDPITLPPVELSDLMIRTKDRRLVRFVPNEIQVAYLDILAAEYPPFDWRNGIYTLRGLREDCLKFRQPGISTLWLALYFLDTINNPLIETVIYAHDGEGTEKLFRMVHRFYQHLPAHKKRPIRYSNKRELVFEDIDSGLYVGMVGGETLGRGGTTNNAHLSERAWSKRFAELEMGLIQSVPDAGNITRETTANGLNEYYDERQAIRDGRSVFRGRFFAWKDHAEYSTPAPAEFVPEPDEQELIDLYGLTFDQLQWRRKKRKEPGMAEKFTQEYPLTEAEAFLSSGHNYFNTKLILRLQEERKLPEYAPIPEIEIEGEDAVLLAQAYREGQLVIYHTPTADGDYLITADTARGEDPVKGDFDAAGVYDLWTRRKMATLHGKWDTTRFGHLLVELGLLYNTALLVPENNNHGWSVIQAIREKRYPENRGSGTHGLYHHDPNSLKQGKEVDPRSWVPGWPTHGAYNVIDDTKGFALDKLKTIFEQSEHDLSLARMFDLPTLDECLRFVHLPGGKAGGEGSAHDDRVTEASIAAAMFSLRWKRSKTNKLTPPVKREKYARRIR